MYVLPPNDQEMYVLHESGILPRDSSPRSDSSSSPTSDPGIGIEPPKESTQSKISPSPAISAPLRRLLDEASDIMDSPQSTRTTTLLLDALFSQLIDNSVRSQAFKSTNPSLEVPFPRIQELGVDEVEIPKSKLATILAILTRQAHAIVGSDPNVYMQVMDNVRELEAFSAVIYSSNFGIDDSGYVTQEQAAAAAALKRSAGDEHSFQRAESIVSTSTNGVKGIWGMFDNVWNRLSGST